MYSISYSLSHPKSQKIITYLTLFLFCWYILLCTIHYFTQRPLWTDEAAIFLSVNMFSPPDFFTKNLEEGQNFPRLYLFLIQKISRPFEFSLLSLRFLSFVFMLSAFFIWMRTIRYAIKDNFYFLTYVLCWCSSAQLIYYSAELKQYSMDALSSALFVLFLYNQQKLEESPQRWRYRAMLASLPALIAFSYVSFFFFIFPLYNLILSLRKDRERLQDIIIYIASVIFFSTLVYFFDMQLRKVYGYQDYFIYFTSVGEFFKTFGEGTINLFTRFLVERPRILKKIILSFFVFGLLNMFYVFFANIKREGFRLRTIETIALVIYVEMFILGCLKSYPFAVPRTSLFFCPVVLYLTVTGIVNLKKIHPLLYKIIFAGFFLLLVFIFLQLSCLGLQGKMEFAPLLWWFGVEQ